MNNIAIIIKINAATLAIIAYIVPLSICDELVVDVIVDDGKFRIVIMILVDIVRINDEQFCWTTTVSWYASCVGGFDGFNQVILPNWEMENKELYWPLRKYCTEQRLSVLILNKN